MEDPASHFLIHDRTDRNLFSPLNSLLRLTVVVFVIEEWQRGL
jgi:hypothetical protein